VQPEVPVVSRPASLKLEKLTSMDLARPSERGRSVKEQVVGISFVNRGKYVLVVGRDGLIKLWDAWKWKETYSAAVGPQGGGSARVQQHFPHALAFYYVNGANLHLARFSLTEMPGGGGTAVGKATVVEAPPYRYSEGWVTLSPDGLTAAVGPDSQPLTFWEVQSGTKWDSPLVRAVQSSLAAKGSPRMRPEFSPDGKLLLLAENQRAEIWDLKNARPICSLQCPGSAISQWLFTPDSKHIAVCYGNATVWLHDATTGEGRKLIEPTNRSAMLYGLAFSPDGKTLAATTSYFPKENGVGLWDTATGHLRGQLNDLGTTTGPLAFSPDGKKLAVGIYATVTIYGIEEDNAAPEK